MENHSQILGRAWEILWKRKKKDSLRQRGPEHHGETQIQVTRYHSGSHRLSRISENLHVTDIDLVCRLVSLWDSGQWEQGLSLALLPAWDPFPPNWLLNPALILGEVPIICYVLLISLGGPQFS